MFRGDDALGLFVTAIEKSSRFRTEIASGDQAKIGFALDLVGIHLDEPFQDNLILACVQIANNPNGWTLNDNLRKALAMQDTGVVG